MKICLAAWNLRQSAKDSHQNPALISILPPKEWPEMARATLGCVATAPQGPWMGTKRQQRSLIKTEGEYVEENNIYTHSSLSLFPPHRLCIAAVGVQRHFLLPMNFSNKKDYERVL